MKIPDDPDTLFTRRQAADALTTRGFPTSVGTLSTKATRGGGPIYRHFGPRVLYRWGDLLAWAEARLSPPRGSTSEADAPIGRHGRRAARLAAEAGTATPT
jgi:hypothetical protein